MPDPSETPPVERRTTRQQAQQRRRHGLAWLVGGAYFPRGTFWYAAAVVCVALLSGHSGPVAQVSRMLGSVASVAEASSTAAGAVITAGANMTEVVSVAFVGAAQNSLTLAGDMWFGIDIHNIAMRRIDGTIDSVDGTLLCKWLSSDVGRRVVPVPAGFLDILTDVVSSVSSTLTAVARSDTLLDWHGQYHSIHAESSILTFGKIRLKWQWTALNFSLQWSNPLWELCEFDTQKEGQQIINRLQSTISAMTPVVVAVSPAEVELAEVELWRVLLARLYAQARWVDSWLWWSFCWLSGIQ